MKIAKWAFLACAVLVDASGCGSAIYYHRYGTVPDWPMWPFLVGMLGVVGIAVGAGINALIRGYVRWFIEYKRTPEESK